MTPIIIDQFLAKIFEKCICDQIRSHCQSEFRSLHSTLTALVDAANSWSVNIDNDLVNGVVFILNRPLTPLIIVSSYGSSVYMMLTQSVLSGLSPIFSTEVKEVT